MSNDTTYSDPQPADAHFEPIPTTLLANGITFNHRISDGAYRLYALLAATPGQIMTRRMIAEHLGVGVRTISARIRELKAEGILRVEQVMDECEGQGSLFILDHGVEQ